MATPEQPDPGEMVQITVDLRSTMSEEEVAEAVIAAWRLARPLPAPEIPAAQEAASEAPAAPETVGWGIESQETVGIPGIRISEPVP